MFIIFCTEMSCLKLVSHHKLIFCCGRFAEMEKEREINLKAAPCFFCNSMLVCVQRRERSVHCSPISQIQGFFGLYLPLLWAFLLCWIRTSLAETWPCKEMCGLCFTHTMASQAGCGFTGVSQLSASTESSLSAPSSAWQVWHGSVVTFSMEFWRIT